MYFIFYDESNVIKIPSQESDIFIFKILSKIKKKKKKWNQTHKAFHILFQQFECITAII